MGDGGRRAATRAAPPLRQDPGEFMVEKAEDVLPAERHKLLTALSGPSFAKEVAAGMPTAVSVAGHDPEVCLRVQTAFSTDRFRVYTTVFYGDPAPEDFTGIPE